MKWWMEPCFQVVYLAFGPPKMCFFFYLLCVFFNLPLSSGIAPFIELKNSIFFYKNTFTSCVLPITRRVIGSIHQIIGLQSCMLFSFLAHHVAIYYVV
jgi:hypothetical protein